jgi:hypothetical protein
MFFRNLPVAALKKVLKTAAMKHAITLIVTPKQQTLPFNLLPAYLTAFAVIYAGNSREI